MFGVLYFYLSLFPKQISHLNFNQKNKTMRSKLFMLLLATVSFILMSNSSCDETSYTTPQSSTGVEKMTVEVKTNSAGHTVEQENIAARYKLDNAFGAIKHLYIISPYSGQVIIYSTVKGKVTSSGKRLTPITVVDNGGEYISNSYGFDVKIGGHSARTTEVLQDDGTYGTSIEYLYWWDSKGIYHQQYVEGCLIHISDQPLSGVKSVIINLESQ